MEDLLRKVRVATTLGTWQATLTQWKEGGEGLRAQWRQNTVEERLLGVSLTGAHPPAALLSPLGPRHNLSVCNEAVYAVLAHLDIFTAAVQRARLHAWAFKLLL